MHPFLEKLLSGGVVLTDGAWGTELQARGLAVGDFPDTWNLTHPERVAEVAKAYVDAGSRVILTNTFGSNQVRLAGHGTTASVSDLNRRGVELSRQATADRAFVFASIGPSGKMIMTGETTPEELQAGFEEQARALAQGGAHALVVETMADLAEAEIAVKAAKVTGLPVVACMVFDSGKNKDRTMMGNTPEQCAETLAAAGADVVGANCGLGIEAFLPICQRLKAACSLPIWIKPNAGMPQMVDGRPVYAVSPADFAKYGPELVAAGASFLGACCGSNPQFIRALKAQLG